MKFDIVFVTFNSGKWLEPNIKSILKSDYDLKKISLYYYDNASTDDTPEVLKNIQNKYSDYFNEVKIVFGNKNRGFGYGNNRAAECGHGDYVFILNTDTEVYPDTFKKLEKEINEADKDFAAFELRQVPYEHPKYYNPVNMETSWASGACLIVKRDVFDRLKGFDERMFMYCEDVELSWRIRQNGYRIKYLYSVPVIHWSYSKPGEFKKTAYIYGYVNNAYLRAKYGTFLNAMRGLQLVHHAEKSALPDSVSPADAKTIHKEIKVANRKMFFHYLSARIYKHHHKNSDNFEPQFIDYIGYEYPKMNPFLNQLELKEPIRKPLVSIIVRTHARPQVLRECLQSIRHQSYKNIETVVIEDGENTSEEMIKNEFNDMNIIYHATGKHVGRSHAGNIGLSMAHGEYLNFLDDDDFFFPQHVERLLREAVNNNYEIVYDTAFAINAETVSENPYKYKIVKMSVLTYGEFSRFNLMRYNLFPIQAVMFKKSVYEELGGIDENIETLEDWELWLRYSFKYTYHYVRDTTSAFKVPADEKEYEERREFINQTKSYILKKYENKKIEFTLFDIYNARV